MDDTLNKGLCECEGGWGEDPYCAVHGIGNGGRHAAVHNQLCSADELEQLIRLEANAQTFEQIETRQMNMSSWLVSRRHSILSALRAQAGEKS